MSLQSITSGLTHLAGIPVAGAAELGGAVGSVGGLLPNTTASRLTHLGHNISNPNTVYTGPTNPLYLHAGTVFSPVQSSNSIAQPAPSNPTSNNAVPGATTTASNLTSGGLTPDQVAYYQKMYETQLGGLNHQLAQLGQQRDVNNLQLQQQFQNSQNALNTQHAQGVRNLDFSQNQLQQSRAQSLADIAKQVEQMGMGYNNQLGALGAGNSSASMMINRALAQQAANNRGSVIRDASQQQQGLDMQRADLEQNYQDQIGALNQWKQQQVNDLINSYNDNYQKLQEAIANAKGQEAQQLAQYQPQLIQSAIDALSNLQTVYNNTSNDLVKQYQDASKASFNINPALQQFEVSPVNAGQVAQVPGAAPIQNQQFDPVAVLLHRRDQNGNPIVPIGG